jgi:hypothetical protein
MSVIGAVEERKKASDYANERYWSSGSMKKGLGLRQ